MDAFISTLPGVFDAIEASDEVRAAFVFAAWRTIAGEQVCERTSPLLVEERRLVIAVSDKTWQRNLESLGSQLLFKLNAVLGSSLVDFIEFRVSATDIVPSAAKSEWSEEVVPAPMEITVSARSIRSEELRATVLKAASNCMARTK